MNWDRPDRGNWRPLVWIFLLILAVVITSIGVSALGRGSIALEISYNTLHDQLKAGNVEQVTISGQEITGTFKQPVMLESKTGGKALSNDFRTYFIPNGDVALLPLLEAEQVKVEIQPRRDLSQWQIVLNILPLVVLVGLAYLLLKRVQPSGPDASPMLRSGAKPYGGGKVRASSADVAGAQGTKGELQEIIEFLRDPVRF